MQKGWGGQSVRRKNAKRLLQGEGVFVDDIKRHRMGYLPSCAARMRTRTSRGSTSRQPGLDGVYGTLTGGGRGAHGSVLRSRARRAPTSRTSRSPSAGALRGEPVVAVVAETRELARDASELVEVDYEPLRRSSCPQGAGSDARCSDDADGNLMWTSLYSWGDLDTAFAEADRVVKIPELHFHRFNSTPLECDGALVEFNRGVGQWTIHEQPVPRLLHDLDRAGDEGGARQARFVTQDIGGSYGNKIVASAARRLLPARPASSTGRCSGPNGAPTSTLDVARQRALVPRHRGGRQDDGTLLGFRTKALDDAAPGCATSRSAA